MPQAGRQGWDLHGMAVNAVWENAAVGERLAATFASRPPAVADDPGVSIRLQLVEAVPVAPNRTPDFEQGTLLAYFLDGPAAAIAHFPRYGQLRLDLAQARTEGVLTRAALATHGVFEDLVAIGLSPHLRRRGRFLLHAFAAAPGRGQPAALLVGDMGAGKTTTGLALLHAGWKLLSNDSPILDQGSDPGPDDPPLILAYPGQLSAFPDTLARFAELATLCPASPAAREKVLFAADSIYPGVWLERALPGAIVFPQIEARDGHALERLAAPEALRTILPHAIEQWDRALIPTHLALLRRLLHTTPAYRLRLANEVRNLPEVIAESLLYRTLTR